MTAIDARDLTMLVGNGQSPESFTELGGLQEHRLSIQANPVEANNVDAAYSWQNLLESAGRKQIQLSGAGVFTDSSSEERLRGAAFSGELVNLQIQLGNGDTISAAFAVVQLQRAAAMTEAIEYRFRLHSAGEVNFTSA